MVSEKDDNIIIPVLMVCGAIIIVVLTLCIVKCLNRRRHSRYNKLSEANDTRLDQEMDHVRAGRVGEAETNEEQLSLMRERRLMDPDVEATGRDAPPGGVVTVGPVLHIDRNPVSPAVLEAADVTVDSHTSLAVTAAQVVLPSNHAFNGEPITQPRVDQLPDDSYILSSSSQELLPECSATRLFDANQAAPLPHILVPTAHPIPTDMNRAPASSLFVISESDVAINHWRTNRDNAEAQLAALTPVHHSSPEAAQIASMMQQMDDMWLAIARLRQAHLERTPVRMVLDERSDVGSSLPDYASIDDQLEDSRSTRQACP